MEAVPLAWAAGKNAHCSSWRSLWWGTQGKALGGAGQWWAWGALEASS